ncbi:MAG: UTP--glucose-1-phosphate uridylyltransferase GalU [Candidatus Sungiibacteriota bacterium]|uniref:UTP--glucose-1-phosphate uridylyltransferase n=1 Tax=Candidatus Sungiibacteriota bacterium TaxID=2750080 RepID=A0A7T5RJT5_9BACT|nr:MAG: UTP--glucose-1-phosphate uridylyltransferase GalU [Candidatus Sungbacteria bacterium]
MTDIKKVIIPVGGFGTRFLPATKAQPKEMLPIVDKPVIQYLVEEAVASGMKEVILITGRGKRAIEDHFDHASELESYLEAKGKSELARTVRKISSMAFFSFVRQKEPRGIGDAVLQARPLLGKEPVAIMSGDDIIDAKPPALKQLVRIFKKYRAPVVGVARVSDSEIHKYGVIAGKKIAPRTWRVTGTIEKPKPGTAPSNLAIFVKYIFTPEIFEYLAKVKPASNGEIYIPPALDKYIKDGGRFYAYEVKGEWYDCGDKLGYLRAVIDFGLKHSEVGKEFRRYLKTVR